MPKVSMKLRGDGSTVFIWPEDMAACTISRTMPSCRQFDGTLITGQNPLSSKEMAKVVLNHLTKREIR